jgi:CDP-glucose 4,6-dehydratase
MEHNIADIRDLNLMRKLLDDFKPEVIFHMAAQPLVRESYINPIDTFETNVMGTANILESSRHSGSVKAIVNITTDKCYENLGINRGYKENERLGGYDPYSSSKACAELVSNAYRLSFLKEDNIAMATARAGNVIGGGDWAYDRLLPDTLHALETGQIVQIRNPNAIRPWQHVLEPLSGYLVLAEKLYLEGHEFAEGWNFGPNDEDARPVSWVVEHLCETWGTNANWENQPGEHPHEAQYLKLDISKARKYLDWTPRWSLKDALYHVIEWHKASLRDKDMRSKTMEQIHTYSTLI